MTKQEAVQAYVEQFGGFPFMAVRGLPEDVLVELVQKALASGEEIAFERNEDITI